MNLETWKNTTRLLHIIKLFENNRQRSWRTREIADHVGVNVDTAQKDLDDLSISGLLPITYERLHWSLPEDAVIPRLELSLSYPEASSLYLAGRMLAQIEDEQNWHITMALSKLVAAMPPSLQEQQNTLLELLTFVEKEDDEHQRDLSKIFQDKDRVLRHIVLPYTQIRSSRSYSWYQRIASADK